MANILQRIFYKPYQCQIIDMIAEYDVHHRYDEWVNLESQCDAKYSQQSYSIRDRKFFIVATCSYDVNATPRVSYRLYMEDNRPASHIPYQATQQNTKFAETIYRKMLSKYEATHNVR